MSVKEIKEQSEFLYQKSSHYIATIFIIVGTIIGTVTRFSYYVPFLVLSILIMPLELGQVRALFKASDRKARDVDTKKYVLMGLKEYPSAFSVFVGKTLVVILIQSLIILAGMFFAHASVEDVKLCIQTVITGGINFIMSKNEAGQIVWAVPSIMIFAAAIALVVGVVLEIKFALTYYFAVDKEYSLFESLGASWKALKGNTFKYIRVLLSFFWSFVGASVLTYIATVALQNGFMQLIQLLPSYGALIDCILRFILALTSTSIAVMFYKVKMQLAVVLFYKDITK